MIDPEHHQCSELLQRCNLIIWDEAPMANRAVLACVEECCQKVMGNQIPFSGKVVILLGDFRQTCLVIRRGTKADVLNVSISQCNIWPSFQIARLTTPNRNAIDLHFAWYVDNIGEGEGPQIDLFFLTHTTDIEDVIRFVYNRDVLSNPTTCLQRCILVPTNVQVDVYNKAVLELLPSTSRQYNVADSLEEHDEVMGTMNPDSDINSPLPSPNAVLNFMRYRCPNGMPNYSLMVKIGGVYRLLRNFSIELGLVKNARVVVTGIGSKLITVHLLQSAQAPGVNPGDVLLPRITFKERLLSGHTLCR